MYIALHKVYVALHWLSAFLADAEKWVCSATSRVCSATSILADFAQLRGVAPDTPKLRFECSLDRWKACRVFFLTQVVWIRSHLYIKRYDDSTLSWSKEWIALIKFSHLLHFPWPLGVPSNLQCFFSDSLNLGRDLLGASRSRLFGSYPWRPKRVLFLRFTYKGQNHHFRAISFKLINLCTLVWQKGDR